MRRLYSVLWYLILPGVMLRLWWKGRRLPGYRERWAERFGHVAPIAGASTLWVHAVSVGEVQAAVPIVRALRSAYRDSTLVLTTMTPTGSDRVRQAFSQTLGNGLVHVYAPYDTPRAVRRFLAAVRPRLLLLMETELWPNLIHSCHTAGIPVIVANARLSQRSFDGYRRFARLTARMLNEVSAVAAQGAKDAERFIALGAPAARVTVTGNVKFDLMLPASLSEQAQELRRLWGEDRPVWVAASTHEGEEEQVLAALALVREVLPQNLLALVPRHPERFAKVGELCRRRGYTTVSRSSGGRCTADTHVFLGDSMGELMMFYAAADVAFVGGSLVPIGGHNPVEPAACGLPVLFGPHTFNFEEISRMMLEAGAALQVQDAQALAARVSECLRDTGLRRTIGESGKVLAEKHRGAVDRLMQVLANYIGPPERP